MRDYGLSVYRGGLVLHSDGRRWVESPWGWWYAVARRRLWEPVRGRVGKFSEASQKRLEFLAACVGVEFCSLVTLTYHANVEQWEADAARNRRIAQRSKRDLNRFLSCLRGSLGAYVWVQEFQERGVVHFHLLSEQEISEERARVAWCRATDSLGDPDAVRHAVKVENIRSERGARSYVGRYLGKRRQKLLPPGVEGCGRWWGASRGVKLALLEEVVSCAAKDCRIDPCAVRVVRSLRRYLRKRLGFKFRGGALVDWGGELTTKLQQMVGRLREFYREAGASGRRRTAWDVELPGREGGRSWDS